LNLGLPNSRRMSKPLDYLAIIVSLTTFNVCITSYSTHTLDPHRDYKVPFLGFSGSCVYSKVTSVNRAHNLLSSKIMAGPGFEPRPSQLWGVVLTTRLSSRYSLPRCVQYINYIIFQGGSRIRNLNINLPSCTYLFAFGVDLTFCLSSYV
jgi:hypothetical protein